MKQMQNIQIQNSGYTITKDNKTSADTNTKWNKCKWYKYKIADIQKQKIRRLSVDTNGWWQRAKSSPSSLR